LLDRSLEDLRDVQRTGRRRSVVGMIPLSGLSALQDASGRGGRHRCLPHDGARGLASDRNAQHLAARLEADRFELGRRGEVGGRNLWPGARGAAAWSWYVIGKAMRDAHCVRLKCEEDAFSSELVGFQQRSSGAGPAWDVVAGEPPTVRRLVVVSDGDVAQRVDRNSGASTSVRPTSLHRILRTTRCGTSALIVEGGGEFRPVVGDELAMTGALPTSSTRLPTHATTLRLPTTMIRPSPPTTTRARPHRRANEEAGASSSRSRAAGSKGAAKPLSLSIPLLLKRGYATVGTVKPSAGGSSSRS